MNMQAMGTAERLFVGGEWVAPSDGGIVDVINPATEETVARAALGGPRDVDRAVRAAHAAFAEWAGRSVAERAAVLRRAGELIEARAGELAGLLTLEVGSPQRIAT